MRCYLLGRSAPFSSSMASQRRSKSSNCTAAAQQVKDFLLAAELRQRGEDDAPQLGGRPNCASMQDAIA